MKVVFNLLTITVLSTACGTAQPGAQADGTTTTATGTKVATTEAPVQESAKSEAKTPEAAPAKVEKPAQLTQDQMLRASIRLIFDANMDKGRMFHDEVYQAYFYKGDEGTMAYPDSTYVPVTSRNIAAACPLGFKQVGQIDLSIAISHGLFSALPPESQWVWTSWKSAGSADQSYSALVTSDFTDAWNNTFASQMFYPRHKSRMLGRLYCMMNITDLPNIDDLPPGYMETLKGH